MDGVLNYGNYSFLKRDFLVLRVSRLKIGRREPILYQM